MEVHHHPDLHHKNKHLKEYFLEFIMIFLAVTLGFFAESYRESRVERSREREFVRSMIEDAQTDTANIQKAIALNNIRISNLDLLTTTCFNYGMLGSSDSTIYIAFRKCIRHPDFISPTERTLTQLKNSGGMRLLLSKVASDSIILYDDFAKKLTDQQTYYERYLNMMVDKSMQMFNYRFFNDWDLAKPDYNSARLLNTDKIKLIELGNQASIYKAVVKFYIKRLEEGNVHAVNLISTLKREYKIE